MHLGMLCSSLLHWFYVTISHCWWSSFALFDDFCLPIFLLITFQRFSLEFRSWDWAAHDRVLIWCSFIHILLIDLAVWHAALSCWKKTVLSWGTLPEQKEASVFPGYPCIWLDSQVLRKDEPAQFQPCWSIPRSLPILLQISQWVQDTGLYTSPGLRLTIRYPAVRQSWNSSEKMTLLQWSNLYGLLQISALLHCMTWVLPLEACYKLFLPCASPQLPFAIPFVGHLMLSCGSWLTFE